MNTQSSESPDFLTDVGLLPDLSPEGGQGNASTPDLYDAIQFARPGSQNDLGSIDLGILGDVSVGDASLSLLPQAIEEVLSQNIEDVLPHEAEDQASEHTADTIEVVPRETGLTSSNDVGSLSFLEWQSSSFSVDRLYCPMPWPDDMLASPERRFLWQYFLSIAEADFLCLDWEDVGHFYGFQHPYVTTLPHMALSNDSLRGAIFCFAASQYQLRHGQFEFESTRGWAGSEAALALRSQITKQSDDDSSLLSMVSAATLLHYFGTERHDYLRMAAKLVALFLSRSKLRSSSSTSFPEIALTEFRWSVISTLCSLQQPTAPLGDQTCRLIEMGEYEIKQKYSQAFQSWVSHPIFTFSPRLVNPLLRIGQLLEKQLLQLDDKDAQELDLAWSARVAEAEEMLLHARECDVNASKSALGSADPAAVLALNESMYAAGAILLYARIHGLPFTAPFIRRQTQIVSDEIAKIPSNSRVSFAIVFPLFIAGCEAVEQQTRIAITERLREPKGIAFDRGDLVGALHHIWEIRDLNPGLPWPHWVKKGEPLHCYVIRS